MIERKWLARDNRGHSWSLVLVDDVLGFCKKLASIYRIEGQPTFWAIHRYQYPDSILIYRSLRRAAMMLVETL